MSDAGIGYSGPLWHVAYVEPKAEDRVSDAIRDELGYPVYGPVEHVIEVRRGLKVSVSRPYFPRYLFVAVDPYREDWQRLLDVEGVVDVLGKPALDNDRLLPSHVPAAWIAAMRHAQDCGVFDRTKPNASKFSVGERVRVSEGPFSGFNAVVEEFIAKLSHVRAAKRAKVLIEFMGRMMPFDLDVMALEKL